LYTCGLHLLCGYNDATLLLHHLLRRVAGWAYLLRKGGTKRY